MDVRPVGVSAVLIHVHVFPHVFPIGCKLCSQIGPNLVSVGTKTEFIATLSVLRRVGTHGLRKYFS